MPGIGQLLRLAFAVGALIGAGGGVLGTLATQSTYDAIAKRTKKTKKPPSSEGVGSIEEPQQGNS